MRVKWYLIEAEEGRFGKQFSGFSFDELAATLESAAAANEASEREIARRWGREPDLGDDREAAVELLRLVREAAAEGAGMHEIEPMDFSWSYHPWLLIIPETE